jgi:microsomal epoxide hydrolase
VAVARYQTELSGYAILQSQRPQTVAYALTDSPVGQLAWIVEKFKDWTDSTNQPEDAVVDRDQLLTNVTLSWHTRTAGSSAQFYRDAGFFGQPVVPSRTPMGVAVFPKDIGLPIRRLAEKTNNIVQWTEFDRGGHFAAMEQPDVLVKDLRAFARRIR